MGSAVLEEVKECVIMVSVERDEGSVSCVACGSRDLDPSSLRSIKFSKDGKISYCTGTICPKCRLELMSVLAEDIKALL